MHICHVTAHLPPDQAANALLPVHLGNWARDAGHTVSYIAYPPRSVADPTPEQLERAAAGLPGPVTWVPARTRPSGLSRLLRLSSMTHALAIRRVIDSTLEAADVVHVHSLGLLPEVAGLAAAELGRHFVLTLYGTEIWHYKRRVFPPQLFDRMYWRAGRVAFYSQTLLDRARELGLGREGMSVIYPPVPAHFRRQDTAARAAAREALGLTRSRILVNVKRLHPLAGQQYLIEAMPGILRAHPDTQLVVCGTGPLAAELAQQAANLGVSDHVTFTGLVDNARVALYYTAADLFVLPSMLEACPTVAIEALACGTPVVSSDNPGGVELGRLFGDDVAVVPRQDSSRLAAAVSAFLDQPRRTRESSDAVVEREFRMNVSAGRYGSLYWSLRH